MSERHLQANAELSIRPETLKLQLREMEINPEDYFVVLPGVSRFYSLGVVLRFMLMYDKGDGYPQFVGARQGRNTYESHTAAASQLRKMLRNNSDARLTSLYSGPKAIFIGFAACYGGHYDPAPIALGSTLKAPADIFHMDRLRVLALSIDQARKAIEEDRALCQ